MCLARYQGCHLAPLHRPCTKRGLVSRIIFDTVVHMIFIGFFLFSWMTRLILVFVFSGSIDQVLLDGADRIFALPPRCHLPPNKKRKRKRAAACPDDTGGGARLPSRVAGSASVIYASSPSLPEILCGASFLARLPRRDANIPNLKRRL